MTRKPRTARPVEVFEPGAALSRRALGHVRRVLDPVAVAVFFLTVTLAALPMGGNRDWAWAPLCIVLGGVAVLVACGIGNRSGLPLAAAEKGPLLALGGCFAVFLAFALWQMSPLAPRAGDAWLFDRAAAILGTAQAPVPAVAADLARNSLLRCAACALAFLIARTLCRDVVYARWLLRMLVASAILVVVYGILMQISTHSCYVGSYLKKQFGYAPSDFCSMSGTFVNSNSFACYVGMAATVLLALLFSGGDRASEDGDWERHGGVLDWLNGRRVFQVALLLLLLGGLLLAASRGGFAATAVGVLALAALMMRDRGRSQSDLGRAILIGVVVFLAIGLLAGGALVGKFKSAEQADGRLIIWAATLEAIGLSPWLGWGLGGYPDAYMIVQPAAMLQPNDLAHSTPLEIVVELGIVAAIPAFALVVVPWLVCLNGALRRRLSHRYLPTAAFAGAAVAILHSMIDFSLQMPAIALVVSALLGMGWAQAFSRRASRPEDFTQAP
ncbi:O-antigen ligase family protein [soil metagenome]